MDLEEVTLRLSNEVSRFSGEIENFKGQVSCLKSSVEKLDDKLNKVIIREAERTGEARGIKRSALVISGIVSLIVSIISAAGVVIAYVR